MSDVTELASFVERQAGDQLRAVGEFDGIRTELHYVRGDLDETRIRERLELIQDNITWSWSPPDDELDAALGPKSASLQVRRDVVIVHLPADVDRGVLIGLEPEAATDLTTFVGRCLSYTRENR